jgi:hypothetical protein
LHCDIYDNMKTDLEATLVRRCGLGSFRLEQISVTGSCKYGNEHSRSLIDNFILMKQLSEYQLLKKASTA